MILMTMYIKADRCWYYFYDYWESPDGTYVPFAHKGEISIS